MGIRTTCICILVVKKVQLNRTGRNGSCRLLITFGRQSILHSVNEPVLELEASLVTCWDQLEVLSRQAKMYCTNVSWSNVRLGKQSLQ